MKSDVVFALENAGWPALLVDGSGTILRATQAAVKIFGSVLEGAAPRLSALWPPENGVTAEQFLMHWERSLATSVPLKFRVKGGIVSTFTVAVCSFSKDSGKFFALQLLPEAAPAPGPGPGPGPGRLESPGSRSQPGPETEIGMRAATGAHGVARL